jgi:hypothetical protein
MVWLNVLAAAAGLGLMGALAMRMIAARAVAILVTLGLGLSYAYWREAGDATTYPASIACVLGAALLLRVGMDRDGQRAVVWRAAAGALHGLAVGLHIAMLLFYPAALLGLLASTRRGTSQRLISTLPYSIAFALTGLVPLFAAAFAVARVHSMLGALSWLLSSSHGQAGEWSLSGLVRAGYGLTNTFVFLDALGTSIRTAASAHSLQSAEALLRSHCLALVCLLLTACLLVAVLLVGVRRAPILRSRNAGNIRWLVAWVIPFAALGLYYFPSDPERWFMILPPLWLLIGIVVDAAPAQRVVGGWGGLCVAVAFMGAINGACGIIPARSLNSNERYTAARAINSEVGDKDLVIMAGRSDPGYLWYFFGHRDNISLYWEWLSDRDLAVLTRRLSQRVIVAEERGGKAWLYGDLSTPGDQSAPWTDFAAMGLSKREVRAALSDMVLTRGAEVAPGEWLYRLGTAGSQFRSAER